MKFKILSIPIVITTVAMISHGALFAQAPAPKPNREFLKEEGKDSKYAELYNKVMNLRLSNKNQEALDLFASVYEKDKSMQDWLKNQPDPVKSQIALALENALRKKPIDMDVAFADLKDLVDATGVKWKLQNGGAMIVFKTTEGRDNLVKIRMDRRKAAGIEMIDIDSFCYDGTSIPEPATLHQCLVNNATYNSSKWIIETYNSSDDNNKKHMRLILRASIPSNTEPKFILSLMQDLALKADAFEKQYFKADKM